MRVRPFFWMLLATTCIGVLIFAATVRLSEPASLQVHVAQEHPTADEIVHVVIRITDLQGVPIQRAQIISHANMTNMDMGFMQSHVIEVKPGNYIASLQLYMSGPWAITVSAQAEGFAPLQHTVLVQVA